MKLKILLFLLFASIFSCEVEPFEGVVPEENNQSTSKGEFIVDFNSKTWVANTIQTIVNSDYIAITGMKKSGELFQITIPGAKVGTYTLDMSTPSSAAFALMYTQSSGNIPFLAADDSQGQFSGFPNYKNTAKIVISSIDTSKKTISGTFQFTGVRFPSGTSTTVETMVFTNGKFNNLSYSTDVPAPSGNSFLAKLNGSTYTATNINGVKSSGLIAVIGRKGNIENIGLSIPENATAGTKIDFEALSSDARGQYIDANSGIFGGKGTMTINSHNTSTKRIKGTFSFIAESFTSAVTHNISEGSFDITYN
jgi:Family of unknown function (DUF6252)